MPPQPPLLAYVGAARRVEPVRQTPAWWRRRGRPLLLPSSAHSSLPSDQAMTLAWLRFAADHALELAQLLRAHAHEAVLVEHEQTEAIAGVEEFGASAGCARNGSRSLQSP